MYLDKRVKLFKYLTITIAEIIWVSLFILVFASDVFMINPLIIFIIYLIGVFILAKRDNFGGNLNEGSVS
jgi:hypothetical protein